MLLIRAAVAVYMLVAMFAVSLCITAAESAPDPLERRPQP